MDYKIKYLKYKKKYLELKNIKNLNGGAMAVPVTSPKYVGISITNTKDDTQSTSYFFKTLFDDYDLFNITDLASPNPKPSKNYDYLILTGHCSQGYQPFQDDFGRMYSSGRDYGKIKYVF